MISCAVSTGSVQHWAHEQVYNSEPLVWHMQSKYVNAQSIRRAMLPCFPIVKSASLTCNAIGPHPAQRAELLSELKILCSKPALPYLFQHCGLPHFRL